MQGWAGRVAFQPARLVVEALQCSKLFLAAEPGFRHRGFQHADRLVVYRDRHRKGVTVLPAMGERKPSRVGKPVGRAVDDLGDHRQRPHRPGADTGGQQQPRKIRRAHIGRRRQGRMQPPDIDVAGPHIVMRRHDQMRQYRLVGLCRRRGIARRRQPAHLAHDPVRPERGQQIELAAARWLGAPVGEIDDLAPGLAGNRRMRRVDKAGEAFGEPMVAPRLPAVAVHPLLHDRPVPVIGHDKAVQVEVEPVLHRSTVDFCDEPARRGECGAVKADLGTDVLELMRGPTRMRPAAAAHMNAKIAGERSKTALQRADNTSRDARGMPVHPHNGTKRLEPERVRQAAQQLAAPIMVDDRLADHRAELGHAIGQPSRDVAAMQWQIGTAGFASHQRTPGDRDDCSLVPHHMGSPCPAGIEVVPDFATAGGAAGDRQTGSAARGRALSDRRGQLCR